MEETGVIKSGWVTVRSAVAQCSPTTNRQQSLQCLRYYHGYAMLDGWKLWLRTHHVHHCWVAILNFYGLSWVVCWKRMRETQCELYLYTSQAIANDTTMTAAGTIAKDYQQAASEAQIARIR